MEPVEHMMQKNFDEWSLLKPRVHNRSALQSRPGGDRYFQVRDVWFCSIGINVGHEQDGKHRYFERPVLIIQKFNLDTFWGVPLTSKNKIGVYFSEVHFEGQRSVVLLSQMRLLDARRLLRKIGRITEAEHAVVIENLIAVLKLSGPRNEPEASEPEGVVT